MNVNRVTLRMAFGLITAMVVGGLTISWQESSRLQAKPPSTEEIRFVVTTPSDGDIVIDGVFEDLDGDGIKESDESGVAEGRAGRTNIVVNQPSPALRMDFLAELPCFHEGDIYSLDGGGTLDIFKKNTGAGIRYFFRALGKDGSSVVHYRLDGDAVIDSDNGESFPTGDSGYNVYVTNIRVSQDTGKKGNACEGAFWEAVAFIRLDRQ